MCDSIAQREFDEKDGGFTLIEVLISILITLIVMASVFALLTRGQRSFQREPEIADLQQSARTVIDMVSRDILQAGAGLPPEFPAFSAVRGGDGTPTDSIEMIGTFQLAGEVYLEPEDVMTVTDTVATMVSNTTNFEVDDMIVVYNDVTTGTAPEPQWVLARVTAIFEDEFDTSVQATVSYDIGAYPAVYSRYTALDNSFLATDGRRPKMTRVSVVHYDTVVDTSGDYSGPPPRVLQREVDFSGIPQAVGYLEDFQIRYIIGVATPDERDIPPNPAVDLAGIPLTAENMLSGVRVTVTARSVTAGMEGASQGASAGRDDDFIRKTFSTNVNPRNVSAGLDMRMMAAVTP